jgi:acetyl-CoA carboxylase biotin carboxyl carrier protein
MATFDVSGELVRKLASLLEETGLAEIEYADGPKRIRVCRAAAAGADGIAPTAPASNTTAPPAAPIAAPAPLPAPTPAEPHPGTVTSPMVGTAYLSPEPGASPFVRPGDAVKAGQTILIIEAMKVMNPIKAPRSGTVTLIFISDAQPVEFGEALMVIE